MRQYGQPQDLGFAKVVELSLPLLRFHFMADNVPQEPSLATEGISRKSGHRREKYARRTICQRNIKDTSVKAGKIHDDEKGWGGVTWGSRRRVRVKNLNKIRRKVYVKTDPE